MSTENALFRDLKIRVRHLGESQMNMMPYGRLISHSFYLPEVSSYEEVLKAIHNRLPGCRILSTNYKG